MNSVSMTDLFGNPALADSDVGALEVFARLEAGENRRLIGRVREHAITMDVSEERGGDNAGPTPPEVLILALGGCVLNMTRFLAMEEGLDTTGLTVETSGLGDLDKAFGRSTSNRAGFLGLRVVIKPGVDWPLEARERLKNKLDERCPLCDSLENRTPFELIME